MYQGLSEEAGVMGGGLWCPLTPSSRPGDRLHQVQFTHNQRRPAVRRSISPIPLATTSYHSEGEEPAEDLSELEGIQEPEEQVATDVDEPEPDSNEMETDANEMENDQ